MKISKKTEYAIKALIELAIRFDKGINVVLINDIAMQERIPKKYLEHIMLQLKNTGILVSKRGAGGGYSLSRSPDKISLGEIIKTVEGPLSLLNCSVHDEHTVSQEKNISGLYSIMRDVENAISEIIENISVKDIAIRTTELSEKQQQVSNYII